MTSSLSVLAMSPAEYDGASYDGQPVISKDADGEINLAVIAKGDVKIGNTMEIDGSVYSNGTVYARNGAGNIINGMFISGTKNETQYVSQWEQDDNGNWVENKTYLDGYYLINQDNDELFNGTDSATYGTKPEYQTAIYDADTSFDYTFEGFDVPTAPEYTTRVLWGQGNTAEMSVYEKRTPPVTITSDAYIEQAFINGGYGHAITIDTSEGDVNLIINSLHPTLTGTVNISVVGDHEANIYLNNFLDTPAWTSYYINRDDKQMNSTNYKDLPVDGAAEHTHVFINGDNVVFAHDQISAKDVHINANRLEISGATKYVSDIYTNAEEVLITGGETVVEGTVAAPYAATRVVDSATLKGQLITDTLEINGAASITYQKDAAEKAPAEEPTPEPTATPEPSKEPVPTGTPIDLTGTGYAYIFGYEPDHIELVWNEEEGHSEWDVQIRMAPNDSVTREQVASMIMRMIDQKYDNKSAEYPVTDNMSKLDGAWYTRGLAYEASVGAFDGVDEVTLGPVTRGEVAKLVAFGLSLTDTKETTFADIADSPYKAYIEIMNAYGYMQGLDAETFEPDRVMTRAEFCSMFNQIIGRENASLTAADGTVVTPATYYFTDLHDDEWYTPVMLRATSAYDENGNVDIDTRLANIRNKLDHYDSQKLF